MLVTLVAFFAVMSVLIIAHELGHFMTARLFKIRVEEFGVGYPPRLFGIKRGETIYSINALPFGGFTKMAGEEDPAVPDSLASKSTLARLIVIGAGSLMNALLPLILFSLGFMVPHNVVLGEVAITAVAPASPAESAGIRAGDIMLEINENQVRNVSDLYRNIQLNLGEEIPLTIRHEDGTVEVVRVTPRWKPPAGQGATGISINTLNPSLAEESLPFWEAIPRGFQECLETYVLLKNGIITMIIGVAPVQLAGPVAIAEATGEAARAGLTTLLDFAAFLSINLAVVNLLPLPALDGGRIVFVVIEWLRRGKRISPKTEGLLHLIGFAMLLALILLITVQDIIRLLSGGSLLR